MWCTDFFLGEISLEILIENISDYKMRNKLRTRNSSITITNCARKWAILLTVYRTKWQVAPYTITQR